MAMLAWSCGRPWKATPRRGRRTASRDTSRRRKPDFADAMKDHVLGHHARLQFAFEPEMHRFGNLDEQFARAMTKPASVLPTAGGELVERAGHCTCASPCQTTFARTRVALGRERRVADAGVARAETALQVAFGGVKFHEPFGSSITS